MKHYDRIPNLFLRRTGFYADCTIGELCDELGMRICYTLEPPFRPSGERAVVGNTAIPDGIYPLKMEYDAALRYKCLRVADVRGFKNIRLCFLAKTQATACQTKGSILIGCRLDEDDGMLKDCLPAFEALNDCYEEKRCNHSQLCMQVTSDGFDQRSPVAFCKGDGNGDGSLPDYYLETL